MRIPPSTVVMALVTMVPFGLALRDVARGDGRRLTADEEAAQLEARAELADEARRDTEAHLEDLAASALRDTRTRLLPSLFGAEPASLGPAFGGLRLGMPIDQIAGALGPLRELLLPTAIEFTPGYERGVLTSLEFDLTAGDSDDPDRCTTVAELLGARWGAAATSDNLKVWRHPTTGVRAILDDAEGCSYTIEPSVAAAAWVDARARTAVVPLSLVGQRVDTLLELLPPDAEREGDTFSWTGLGLGAGRGQTALVALVVEGKVVALEATASVVDDAGHDALVAHLTTQLGTPAQEPDNALHWDKRPGLRLTREAGVITLTAGEVP